MDSSSKIGVAVVVMGLLASACGGTARDGNGGNGGSSASGGQGGAGGTGGGGTGGSGNTAGVPGITTTDKIDLLFVVDNSISMGDKQAVLATTVPRLVQRLVGPRCLDGNGQPTGDVSPCPAGQKPEFPPVKDLHVGVITSSLGGHGGNVCGDQPPSNDRARLLPTVRDGVSNPNGLGYLSWTTGQDVAAFVNDFATHVVAAGEQGCGYEAPLESWYRFLVDPAPPANVVQDQGRTVPQGIDDAVLQQRAGFLRSDSLLAIVAVSDENDCSIRDSDVGWYVSTITNPNGTPYPLAKATAACETDPNGPCCRSCADTSPMPAGCSDAGCDGAPLDPATTDRVNLRCWQQKRRFGIDFMYPTARYSNALSRKLICPSNPDLELAECEGGSAENPLFQDLSGSGAPIRSSELVLFMTINGVPWQDLATDASLSDPNHLEYLSSAELASSGRWDWITGDFSDPPGDPLMIESLEPRTGSNPATGIPLAPPSAGPGANPANGHEWLPGNTLGGDLQYACIFPLTTPRECDSATGACDCKGVSSQVSSGSYDKNSPLCQDPSTGAYSSTQYYAKAYPGLRQLEVARDGGAQGLVGSVCPKPLSASDPAYGYSPSIESLVRVIGPRLLE